MHPGKGRDDFPKLILTAAGGAEVEIYLHGAHVTSWRTADGVERLFLSERAEFCEGVAIRGGVPICFPQFAGEGPILSHGFARRTTWTLVRTEQLGNVAQAVLQLEDSPATRAIWPHAFRATMTVTVGGPSLRLELKVENRGDTSFTFTGALHTYLRVDDIATTRVANLAGSHYRDAVTGVLENMEMDQEVSFPGEVDRVYSQPFAQVVVREPTRHTTVLATGFPDLVLWNPGAEKCAALGDMEATGYQHMVCVEAAQVNNPPVIEAGASWCGIQEIRV